MMLNEFCWPPRLMGTRHWQKRTMSVMEADGKQRFVAAKHHIVVQRQLRLVGYVLGEAGRQLKASKDVV
jgi:hypothetical protein